MNKFSSKIFCFFAILVIGFSGCTSGWIDEGPKAISPDGEVVISQTFYKIGGHTRIGVLAWFNVGSSRGGSGVLDIAVDKPDSLEIKWTNDSTVTIIHPMEIEVYQQESSIYFLGRTVYFIYEKEKN